MCGVERFAEVVLFGGQEVVGNGVDHGVTVVGLIVGFHGGQTASKGVAQRSGTDHILLAFDGFGSQTTGSEAAHVGHRDCRSNHRVLLLRCDAFETQAVHHLGCLSRNCFQSGVQAADLAFGHGFQTEGFGNFSQRSGVACVSNDAANCGQNLAGVGIVFLTTSFCGKQIGHL